MEHVANMPPADLVQAKARILDEIQRTARENSGTPLGQRRFEEETGIAISAWRGKFWARWSDALEEAGFAPNRPKEAHDASRLLEHLARLTIQLKRFPTYGDTRMARSNDPTVPGHQAFAKLGSTARRLELVRALARERIEFVTHWTTFPTWKATPPRAAAPIWVTDPCTCSNSASTTRSENHSRFLADIARSRSSSPKSPMWST